MKKRIVIGIMILVLVMSGCGKKEETMDSNTSVEYSEEEKKGETSSAPAFEAPMEDIGLDNSMSFDEEVSESGNSEGSVNQALAGKVDARKYILTYRYILETLNYEETEQKLKDLVDFNFGFFQAAESSGKSIITNGYNRRRGNYTIRIPKEKVEEFTEGLAGIANVLDSNSFANDVTSQYFDLEARIKTLTIQEERLLAILEKADELEYVIQLERELSSVRYEIESFQTNFRNLSDQIDYSTVYVELNEVIKVTEKVEEPRTFFDKMKSGFMDSVENVVAFLGDLTLFLITNIPVFILLGIIGLVFFVVSKRIFKGVFKKRKFVNNSNTEENKETKE